MHVRQLALIALVAVAGCLSPVDPSSVRIAAIRVTIGDGQHTVDTIRVRRTARIEAAAFASQGYDLGITSFQYASSDTSVATVDQSGIVRGVAPGTATIRVTAPQGHSATVTVVVRTTTVEFTIPLGSAPGDIAFSQDYARGYVTTAGDSLAVIDAFGFLRIRSIAIGLPESHVAASSDAVFITHPAADSVTVVSIGSSTIARRIHVAGAPDAIVASATAAFVASRDATSISVLDASGVIGSIALGGSPRQLAAARTSSLLFATVNTNGVWTLVAADQGRRTTLGSIALPGPTLAVTTNGDGSRVYVLLATGEIRAFTATAAGILTAAGSVATQNGATDIAARVAGPPDLLVAGEPLLLLDGPTLTTFDRVAGAGNGNVAIRPDGLFAFVSAPSSRNINVVGL
jgi:DNA-binding beta-propeller fold protein YncE